METKRYTIRSFESIAVRAAAAQNTKTEDFRIEGARFGVLDLEPKD